MQLTITLREVQGITCLDLNGKIILGKESEALSGQVKELLAARKKKILLNLSGVTHLDNTGVGTVVDIFLKVKQQRGKMALLVPPGPPGPAEERLRYLRLDTAFEIYDSEAEALASLQ